MSAAEEVIKSEQVNIRPRAPVLERFLDGLSSVRFGVILLCILVALSIVGMLVMQQEVEGFDAYYASLTPAEKLVFGNLGIFDIYHTWYYNFLLLILSLNIILASIDRFPSAWRYIVKPKTDGSREWLLGRRKKFQMRADGGDARTIANAVAGVFRKNRLKPIITDRHGVTFVFGQSGRWNRLGAYIVHVFLLILFLGYFVAFQTGRNATVTLAPGDKTNRVNELFFDLDKKFVSEVQVPFTIECTDIQQTLVDPNGEIDVSNTMDWRTEVKIVDPDHGTNSYEISLNKPLSYRGYRFFQAQAVAFGSARKVTLELTPEGGGTPRSVEIARGGSASLDDGTSITLSDFVPDFAIGGNGKPESRSGNYNNPAAVLSVQPPAGNLKQVVAFTPAFADKAPVAGAAKLGYKWRLADFERSPAAHVLSIKYDPYAASFIAWYIGGFGLVGALMFVFFISHRRVWARIEPSKDGSGHDIIIAGEANRNQTSFDDKFEKIASGLKRPEV
jgi:cytochrome c biogenesis protein